MGKAPVFLVILMGGWSAVSLARGDGGVDVLQPAAPGTVRIGGWIGHKIDVCREHVRTQDVDRLVRPFRDHSDGGDGFRCEFWGKWLTSLALADSYRSQPETRARLDEAVRALLATQDADGYIGTYQPAHHLANWDVWGRKYVLLGLVAAIDRTGNPDALRAARRVLDHLIRETDRGHVNLTETGLDLLKGLPPSSIIEPVVLLYQRTGERAYRQFAEDIVTRWSQPYRFSPGGLRLIEDALADVPPARIAAPKAYEMMSCYEGLCALYRVTGDPRHRDAALHFARSIRRTELMVDGSCSNQELWCDGARLQTEMLEQPQETCVTASWMKLCVQLLRLTGDPLWADELERSLYNALAGAMMPDGGWWSYWTPLTGQRVPSAQQFQDVGLSCCVASGPRGLLLTPSWAVMTAKDGPVVNLYAPGTATTHLADGTEVRIEQETDYPVGARVRLTVSPAVPRRFPVRLRIPAWSQETTLRVRGEPVSCRPGTYVSIERDWTSGDPIELTLDLRGRAVPAPSGAPQMAVVRGPIVLALDSRLARADDVAVRLHIEANGMVALQPRREKPDAVWMAFEVPFDIKPTHFFNHRQVMLPMCDFASAGNAWSASNLFRTWLPQPLFLRQMFVADTWKLMNPELQRRPEAPGGAKSP
jgi:DUF1680 family protein